MVDNILRSSNTLYSTCWRSNSYPWLGYGLWNYQILRRPQYELQFTLSSTWNQTWYCPNVLHRSVECGWICETSISNHFNIVSSQPKSDGALTSDIKSWEYGRILKFALSKLWYFHYLINASTPLFLLSYSISCGQSMANGVHSNDIVESFWVLQNHLQILIGSEGSIW